MKNQEKKVITATDILNQYLDYEKKKKEFIINFSKDTFKDIMKACKDGSFIDLFDVKDVVDGYYKKITIYHTFVNNQEVIAFKKHKNLNIVNLRIEFFTL